MSVWYAFLNALGIRMFEMDFMKNALLAVLLLGPLFGLLSTMIVTGKMSFFSDALGHSGFTGIAIGVLCGAVQPIYFAVGLSVLFALLFSFVRSRTSQSADTIIGVFSSTAVALGIFIVTLGGRSFTKFNRYLIGDILSVSPQEIGLLALVLLAVVLLWVFGSNRLVLTAVHPQLASSRGIATKRNETLFTVAIAIVVTLAMSWVGLMVINSLLVLPAAASLFVEHARETVYLFSGSVEKYKPFYASALIQHDAMLHLCVERGVARYNFYGIDGVFDDPNSEGRGVLEFKQGFNGYVEELMGSFVLPVRPLAFKLKTSVRKLLRR